MDVRRLCSSISFKDQVSIRPQREVGEDLQKNKEKKECRARDRKRQAWTRPLKLLAISWARWGGDWERTDLRKGIKGAREDVTWKGSARFSPHEREEAGLQDSM